MDTTLQKTAVELNNIFENITHGIAYETDGVIVRVNRAFEKLLGYPRREVIGRQSLQFKEMILEGRSDKLWDESSHTFYVRKKNGDYFWATIETNSFEQDNGLPGSVWTIEDVSRQRDAELRLRQMSLAVDQSSNSVVITDTHGIIQYVNAAFIRTTGFTSKEAIGKTPAILQSGKTPQNRYREMWETITSGREWSGQFINKKKNGEIYEEHVVVAPIRDEQGQITHFIATKENITELKEAKDAAEKASKAKGAFLANMSHEIRTPLNIIIGMTALVLETGLEAKQHRLLSRVKSSADHLLAIVNDILDYSKIEAGMLTIEKHPFSLAGLVQNIHGALSFLAEQKGLEFTVSMPDQPACQLLGDSLRLHQVLYNLVGNGIKFTDRGKVELAVSLEKGEDETCRVTFAVQDTGIGISKEKQKTIFDSFVQEDASTTRHYGGTGLGLSISNELVTLMGGELKVQSVSGLGSRFSFTLALPKTEGALGEENRGAKSLKIEHIPLNLLLAEDNEGNQELATTILKQAGHRVTVANNGMEALELLASGNRYDVILMDVQMPVLDGLTATECIRRIEKEGKAGRPELELLEESLTNNLHGGHLHIIAMTANVMLSDRERYMKAGIDNYLAKPYNKADLLFTLAKRESWAEQPEATATRNREKPGGNAAPAVSYDRCREYLEVNFDVDREQAQNILNTFISSIRESLDELQAAIQTGKREDVRLLGHKLKGALANINLGAQSAIAKTIEGGAHEKELGEIGSLAAAIISELGPLFDIMNK